MSMNLFTLPISGQKILGKINKVRIMGHGKLIQYYTTAHNFFLLLKEKKK